MTQPQYAQQPAQGYAPQQPQPQGWPQQAPQGWQQPQAAPVSPAPVQQMPQQPAPQAYAPSGPVSGGSAMPGFAGAPAAFSSVTLRCFGEGRLLLVMPKKRQTGTKFSKNKNAPAEPQEQIVCDIVALPEPGQAPITFGGKANNTGGMDEPDDQIVQVGPHGWYVPDVMIGSGWLVNELERLMHKNQVRVGRLYKDATYGNWKLTEVANDGPEIQNAMNWYRQFQAGQIVNSVPQPLAPVPVQPQQYAPQPPVQQAPQGWGVPQQPAQFPTSQQVQQAAAQGWGVPQQAPQGWPQQQVPQYAQNPTDMNAPTGY